MKDKVERKLQFVLWYYEDGKLDTRKALKKITGIAHQNKVSGFWTYFSGIAAAILICVVSYTLLSRKEHHTVSITADAMVTRYFLPDSTLAYFSVRKNALSPFIATTEYAQVKVLGTEFEVTECRKDTATRVYVKSGKVVFKGRYGENGIILTKDMCGMLTHGDEMPVAVHAVSPNPSAWATGKFIYRNTPIDEVLKELSLYYGTLLYASEHERTITGEFKTDNLGEIIALIEKTLDIRIIQKEQ